MAKGDLKDSVLNDARNKALEMSHIPDSIKREYDVKIESGYLTIKKKSSRRGSGSSSK